MKKPIIGITMGDASGIGPEIIIKALSDKRVTATCQPLIIGDLKILQRAKKLVGSDLQLEAVLDWDIPVWRADAIPCLDMDLLPSDLVYGKVMGITGDAAYHFVEKAVELAMKGKIQAICTGPLNKEALHLGGHPYPGHTEILAEKSGTNHYAMMFSSPQLNVILVTIHVGLLEAIRMITPERILETIRLGNSAMRQMGYTKPRVAVCGINPHAGEGGLFGAGEEIEKIQPAIEMAKLEGIAISGAYPADTIFFKAIKGEFDLIIAMYHDQGLIPVKTLSMETAVNITVGLPFVRTSVDHGTAFDIAGKGIADETNMKCAIRKAVQMARDNPEII